MAEGVRRDARGRRVAEEDRHGERVAALAWREDGVLASAAVRLPAGDWVALEPRAGHDPRGGASDRLRQGDRVLSDFATVDWARVDRIPALAEPARLPPGAGTAVLNLLAQLAADQGRDRLRYDGPYPTERLFLALLESFRWEPGPRDDPSDPLGVFLRGGLAWSPRPHARAFAPGGVFVQSRGRVEKVVWGGRAYYRPDWQGVERHAPLRVREVGGEVRCSLWALDTPLEDHLVLDADGRVRETRAPAAAAAPPRPLAPAVAAGLVAVVVASSAPALGEALRATAAELAFEWAPVAGDLAAVGDGRARLSSRLLGALSRRLGETASRGEAVQLGFAALTEAAHAVGDALRARAQARLEAAPPAVQAAALARTAPAAAAAAREIGVAVEALLEEAAGQPLA